MRQLNTVELNNISGGDIIDIYPPLLPGLEIIGFSQELVSWDVKRTVEYDFFTGTQYVTITNYPVYNYEPIYAPFGANIHY